MQNDSRKPRRVKVAPGIYRQDGALFANYREPGNGRSRFTKLQATTLRDAKKERESILAALREGRLAARSDITLAALCDEWLATRRGRVADRHLRVRRDAARSGSSPCSATCASRRSPSRDVRRLLAETAMLAEWTRYGMLAHACGRC